MQKNVNASELTGRAKMWMYGSRPYTHKSKLLKISICSSWSNKKKIYHCQSKNVYTQNEGLREGNWYFIEICNVKSYFVYLFGNKVYQDRHIWHLWHRISLLFSGRIQKKVNASELTGHAKMWMYGSRRYTHKCKLILFKIYTSLTSWYPIKICFW